MACDQYVSIAHAEAFQGFTHGIDLVSGGTIMLGEAEDQADLLRGIGSASRRDRVGRLYHVSNDRLAGVVFEFGFRSAPQGHGRGKKAQGQRRAAGCFKISNFHSSGSCQYTVTI